MKHREEDLQMAVAKWIDSQYPDLLWNHNPAGAQMPKKKVGGRWISPTAIRMKKMGSRPGIPDIMVYKGKKIGNANWRLGDKLLPVYEYIGLAIELKVIYPSGKKGVTSDAQKKVLSQLQKEGWKCYVCYTYDEVQKVINWYLGK